MTVRFLEGKYDVMPKGQILQAKETSVHIYVCKENTIWIDVPMSDGDSEERKFIVTDEQECLLRLPADESDIPSIVALIASRAAHRRKR